MQAPFDGRAAIILLCRDTLAFPCHLSTSFGRAHLSPLHIMANSSDSPATPSYDDTMALSIPSPSEAAAAPPELLAGRYAIVGMLGAGGMGTVYRARDTELDELVALKVLRRDLVGDSDALERFRREVKLARRVTHRNVARTFDIGEHQGDRFLTMELVAGEALSSLLARSRPSAAEVAEIAAHVCDGLEAAHAAGVIHRDLKPDNVLIGEGGRVVITDFGIARAYSPDGTEQTLGMVVGTPAYMAPEQVDGSADIDARTDIYALGAMLFEMWTGVRAWPGDSPFVVAAARLQSPPPDPRSHSRAITDEQAELVLRCMARLPADRFPSVAEVRAGLVRVASQTPAGQPSISPRPTTLDGGSLAPSAASRLAIDALLASNDAAPGDKTVAVLSFRNVGSPSDAYLAEGLTEDLIDGLSATAGLAVTPRSAVLAVPADLEPREIGHRLRAQVVVEGAVRRSGGRVRINARVIGVTDGYQLWAQRFDGSDADLFAINDEVARSVATVLTVAPSDKPARVAPTNPEAIDLYLRARVEYQRFWKLNTEAAIGLFERALALAPNDPMILAGYALACVRRQFFGGSSATFDKQAEEAAARAVAIAPGSGDARLAMGSLLFFQGDVRGALREVRDAIRANPNLAEAHGLLGRILVEVGNAEDGLRSLHTALALDPAQAYVRRESIRVQALLGRWDEASKVLGVSSDGSLHDVPDENWMQRMRLILWRRDRDLALRLSDTIGNTTTSPEASLLVSSLLSTVIDGVVPPAILSYRKWASESARAYRMRSFLGQMATEAFAYVGDEERAMEALRFAVDERLLDVLWMERCPVLEPLRARQDFAALRSRVRERAREAMRGLHDPSS